MTKANTTRQQAKPIVLPSDVDIFLESLFIGQIHLKRIRSMTDATLGVLHSGLLGVHSIGHGLAIARGLCDKHAVKQVDRMLSNAGIDVWLMFAQWVPYVLTGMTNAYINLDWTDFDDDNQTMLVASLQTSHGRSVPVAWLTVLKTSLKNMTNEYEFKLLRRLKEVVPKNIHVCIVADRGFSDPALFRVIKDELAYEYIVRFKALINITSDAGITKTANDWLGTYGHMRVLHNAAMTQDKYPVATAVCVCRKGMKEAWCLASSDTKANGNDLIRHYNKRFTIEEMFRDVKDIHYGMGMSWGSIGTPERRDRMFLIAAFAQSLLTLLGLAGEQLGLDRLLKVNTSKTRAYSLFRQGLMWYERIPTMPEERLSKLMKRFSELLTMDTFFGPLFGAE
jgi:hypothetical protein